MTPEEHMIHARINAHIIWAKYDIAAKTLAAYRWLALWKPEIDVLYIYKKCKEEK